MVLGDEKEQVIRDNPKHLKCPHCGHEDDIHAAAAIPEGEGKYTLIFGSDADFCTRCDKPWGRNEAEEEGPQDTKPKTGDQGLKQFLEGSLGEPEQVSPEDIQAAKERYPGLPYPLALAKYMLDKLLFGTGVIELRPGTSWGGIHLETIGQLVQKLADAMYHQAKKEITIIIRADDFPRSYDHLTVEIKEVDVGTEEEAEKFPFTNWPCCACVKPIPPGDAGATIVLLKKKATWVYPTWGNVLQGSGGLASAVICGSCAAAGKQPNHAIKKEGGMFELVSLSELEDIDEPCP